MRWAQGLWRTWPLLDCSGDLPLLWAWGLWRSLSLACVPSRPALLRWARGLWRGLALTFNALGRVTPSPRHFCAGLRLCSGLALTTRGRHAQRLVCPAWARVRVRDRPPLRWAHDLRSLGPYLALGRVLATFALGSDSVAGRPLLRGAATLNGSSVPHGHETVSETGHFCAGHMIPMCQALTLRWAGTGPLLRWARVPLLCPYFALGLALWLMHLPGSLNPGPFFARRPLSTSGALSLSSWLI